MRLSRAVALVAVLGLSVFVGCGGDDDESATPAGTGTNATAAEKKPPKVAIIHYAYTDFAQAEEIGVKEAVEPAGGSVKVFNANFDAQKQQQQCKDAITSGRYNVILLAPSDAPLGVPCATAAKAADIPVVALEVPVGPNRETYKIQLDGVVGSSVLVHNSVVGGQMELLKRACEGLDPCKVIVEIAAPGDPNTGAYVTEAKKLPNVEVVAEVAGGYDPATIAKAFPDLLAANKDVNVFLSAADSQVAAVLPAVRRAGLEGKIKLVGNGGSRFGKKMIQDGTMLYTAANYPQTFGRAAGKMAVQAVNGQPIRPAEIDAYQIKQPIYVDKDNVDQFQPEWGAEAE